MKTRTLIATIGILAASTAAHLHSVAEPARMQNPVMWADVPDPDVIRVGDDYYMVSTTMHLLPGCRVMHSMYLV